MTAYDEERFQDSVEVKSQITSEIMAAAISRTILDETIQPSPAVSYSARRYAKAPPPSSVPNPNFRRARDLLHACMTRFPLLVDVLCDQLADTTSMSTAAFKKQVQEVMLPVLEYMVEERPRLSVDVRTAKLLRVVMDALLETASKDMKAIKTEDVKTVVKVATLPGGPELLVSL